MPSYDFEVDIRSLILAAQTAAKLVKLAEDKDVLDEDEPGTQHPGRQCELIDVASRHDRAQHAHYAHPSHAHAGNAHGTPTVLRMGVPMRRMVPCTLTLMGRQEDRTASHPPATPPATADAVPATRGTIVLLHRIGLPVTTVPAADLPIIRPASPATQPEGRATAAIEQSSTAAGRHLLITAAAAGTLTTRSIRVVRVMAGTRTATAPPPATTTVKAATRVTTEAVASMQAAAMMDMHTVAMRSHIQKMLQQLPSRKMGRVQVGAPRTLTKTATAVTLDSSSGKCSNLDG